MHDRTPTAPSISADHDAAEQRAMDLLEQTVAHMSTLQASLRTLREVIRHGDALPGDPGMHEHLAGCDPSQATPSCGTCEQAGA